MKTLDRKPGSRTIGFGDQAVFFCEVKLQPEDDRFATPEEAASWGSLELWAGGQNLCAHYEGTALLSGVSWYLLPFFEWLVNNWNFVFHEQRPPVSFAGENGWESLNQTNQPDFFMRLRDGAEQASAENYEWSQRHSLWSCRDGGLFPDVVIRRDRDAVEISWGRHAPVGAPADFRFVSATGAVRLPPREVAETLHSVLKEACGALGEYLPESARIRALEEQVSKLANLEEHDLRMAILAGLGKGLTQWQTHWQHLKTRINNEFAPLNKWFEGEASDDLVITGSCEGALMFGSAAPTLREQDVFAIAGKLVEHSRHASKRDAIAEYASETPLEEKPFLEGYRLAEAWGESSGLWSKRGYVNIDSHLAKLKIAVDDIELADHQVGGLAIARTDLAPLILVNTSHDRNSYPSGRRFTLAHELCHLLYDRTLGQEVALISGPWAPPSIEKRANAFAAMLLMPDYAVEEAFAENDGNINNPSLRDLVGTAKWLHVSPDALVHHLENRGWITANQRAMIERKRVELEQQYLLAE